MNNRLSKAFWDVVRPLHRPLTTLLRKRLGRNYVVHPEMELPPAWEAVQFEVERRLHRYLHLSADQIRQVIIIGANEAEEIPRLRLSYPNSKFLCFEPSPQWHQKLVATFGNCDWVECADLALSDEIGTATFYELPMVGNGSLLRPDSDRWAEFNQWKDKTVHAFDVRVSTLDVEATAIDQIDLLWIDVQGAEGKVLKGASETIKRVSAVFLEVALVESPYEGALLFSDLDAMLKAAGFICVGLGIDGWNFTGNALWVRNIAAKTCKPSGN